MNNLIYADNAEIDGGRTHLQSLLPASAAQNTKYEYPVLVRDGMLKGVDCTRFQVGENLTDVSMTGFRRLYFAQRTFSKYLGDGYFDVNLLLLKFGAMLYPTKKILLQRDVLSFYKERFHRQIRARTRGWIVGMSGRRAGISVATVRGQLNNVPTELNGLCICMEESKR